MQLIDRWKVKLILVQVAAYWSVPIGDCRDCDVYKIKLNSWRLLSNTATKLWIFQMLK
jgi:hypothetical protein